MPISRARKWPTTRARTRSVAEQTLQRRAIGTVPITKAILAEQQQIADTFYALKLLPKKISILEAAQADVA